MVSQLNVFFFWPSYEISGPAYLLAVSFLRTLFCLFICFVGGVLNKHTHKSWSNNKIDVCKLNAALEGKTADTMLLKAHGNECSYIS